MELGKIFYQLTQSKLFDNPFPLRKKHLEAEKFCNPQEESL